MSIPQPLPNGLLPVGAHSATLDELHGTFVSSAPNTIERQRLFDALKAWVGAMKQLGVSGVLWIDGGFVTHKPTAPNDVDVVLRIEQSKLDQLSEDDYAIFLSLLTSSPEDGATIKPIGGLVDAFYSPWSKLHRTRYWHELWSRVKGPDDEEVPGVKKGFVEVKI